MNTYIIGDIHGMYDKLISCLKQVNFDYNHDTLIQLGDVVESKYEVVQKDINKPYTT